MKVFTVIRVLWADADGLYCQLDNKELGEIYIWVQPDDPEWEQALAIAATELNEKEYGKLVKAFGG